MKLSLRSTIPATAAFAVNTANQQQNPPTVFASPNHNATQIWQF
jgi:hypothetical protein